MLSVGDAALALPAPLARYFRTQDFGEGEAVLASRDGSKGARDREAGGGEKVVIAPDCLCRGATLPRG
jgi:hypothetical protein